MGLQLGLTMTVSKFLEIIYSVYLLLLVCTYDLFHIVSLELLFCASVHIRERKGACT